jgi:hypothetical protein
MLGFVTERAAIYAAACESRCVKHRRSAFKDGAVIASSWVLLVNALEAHNGESLDG